MLNTDRRYHAVNRFTGRDPSAPQEPVQFRGLHEGPFGHREEEKGVEP